MVAIVWFRNDLRISDHLALTAAIKTKQSILPIYIYDPTSSRPLGGAAQWWLYQSLKSLQKSLKMCQADLIFRQGNAENILKDIFKSLKFSHLFWHCRYDRDGQCQDQNIQAYFENQGVICQSFNGSLLFESYSFQNQAGKPFKTFSSFWKHCLKQPDVPQPVKAPTSISFEPALKIPSDNLDAWKLRSIQHNCDQGFKDIWHPGEQGAQTLFKEFLLKKLFRYKAYRDHPAAFAISDLSAAIHWGEISVRQLWHAVQQTALSEQCESS